MLVVMVIYLLAPKSKLSFLLRTDNTTYDKSNSWEEEMLLHGRGWGRLQKPDYDYSAHKIIDYDYDYSGDWKGDYDYDYNHPITITITVTCLPWKRF